MSLDKEFEKELIWVLRKIEKNRLILNKDQVVFEIVYKGQNMTAPTDDDQRLILKRLENDKVIRIARIETVSGLNYYQAMEGTQYKPLKYYLEIIEPNFSLLIGKTNLASTPPSDEPVFVEEKSVVSWIDKKCSVPFNTNQFIVCKILFSKPFGYKFKEEDIIDQIDRAIRELDRKEKKKRNRTVYDAVRLLNERFKSCFQVSDLLVNDQSHYWINQKYKK